MNIIVQCINLVIFSVIVYIQYDSNYLKVSAQSTLTFYFRPFRSLSKTFYYLQGRPQTGPLIPYNPWCAQISPSKSDCWPNLIFCCLQDFMLKKSSPAWICSSVGCSWIPLESLISCLQLCLSHNGSQGTRPLKQRDKMCTDTCSNRKLSKSKQTLILSCWCKQSILWELSKWLIQVLHRDEVKRQQVVTFL